MVPADLAFVTAEDIGALIAAGGGSAMAIAPDEARDGTNALLLSPPHLIGFSSKRRVDLVVPGLELTILERVEN